jgi:hypothetical protein
MATFVVRQDPIEMTGKVVSFSAPPLIGQPDATPVGQWTVVVKPDPPHQAMLTTRNGNTNIDGNIACTVGIDDRVVGWRQLLPLVSNAFDRRVRIVGTWCDDDDTASTVIHPLGILAIEYDIEVYDVNRWPVAVRDIDLLAFAHAVGGLVTLAEPHAGESRTFTVRLPFPFRPSNTAVPFARVYASTRVDRADTATFTHVATAGIDELEATIETGASAQGKGVFAAQIGLTFDEPELDNFCPLGTCDLEGKHCAHEGRFRFMRVPAHLPYAKKGDLALSPGDGQGFISGIVASLTPRQVFDHMGIFVDNGWTIRHCTGSMERLQDKKLFTAEISVKVAGVIELENQPVPLNGLRPDLARFGWPGAITQTVEEVYRTGRNTLNARWTFAATHPGQDTEDPERPGVPFRIYHLPRADRQRRLQFNDPERDVGEMIVRLQDTSVTIDEPPEQFTPQLVRPHSKFERQVRLTLERVADMARKIEAHYRFFAYSRGDIALDSGFVAPPAGDPSWGSLPASARWPAGTVPAMCSSFVWTAVQLADRDRPPGTLPIELEDRADPPDPARGLEYGARGGFYLYHAQERRKAGINLVGKIQKMIRERFDKEVPGAAYVALPKLILFRDMTAVRVGNQMANTFAFDAAERLDDAWSGAGDGETASPDDIWNFWDLKLPRGGMLIQPEGRQAIYGDSVQLMLPAPQWMRVPLFRKQNIDLGTGKVTGVAFVAGIVTAGVDVRFDFGCATAVTTDNPETAFFVDLGVGTHFAEGFIVLPNPATGNPETFRTARPARFDVALGEVTRIELRLEPPSDLWRIVDVHVDADIHDRSFWGGDADAHDFHIDRPFELRQDLEDNPQAPADQRNTVLHHEEVWRTEPAVGSGVHVAVSIIADLNPADRSVRCHCEVALIDTDSGGFLGIGTSANVDQIERRDVVVRVDKTVEMLKNVDFSSDESVPERARVSLRLTNRRRPI